MALAQADLDCLALQEDRTTVLIIDDNPAERDYYARCLRNRGLNTLSAINSEEGREKLGDQHVDCILLDYLLPKQSGIEFLNDVRNNPKWSHTPAILITGAGSEEVAVSAWKSGAADYLAKDAITEEALQRAVLNAVEKFRLRQMIAQRSVELEIANKELKRRNEEIRRFYQTISHELGTPLAAAKECVSIVHDEIAGKLNDDQKEFLEDATDSHNQLAAHFKELFESTRLENAKLKLQPRPTKLPRVFRRAVAANAKLARDHDIGIEVDLPGGLPNVVADKDRLVQVVCNLLSNAIKHSMTSQAVSLRAEQQGDKVRIEVIDTGCGIEPIHQTGIFERLYQVPQQDADTGGLGLGLSIAQEIIRLHGSEILVQSEPGTGSRFSFELDVDTQSVTHGG